MTEEEVRIITRQLLKEGMIEENENGYTITSKGRNKLNDEKEAPFLTAEDILTGEWSYCCVHLAMSPFLKAVRMEGDDGWTGDMLCEWCAQQDFYGLLEANLIAFFKHDDLDGKSFLAG